MGAGSVGGLFFCTIYIDDLTIAECFSIVAAAAAYIAGEAYIDGRKDRRRRERTLKDELQDLSQLLTDAHISQADYDNRKEALLASWSLPLASNHSTDT